VSSCDDGFARDGVPVPIFPFEGKEPPKVDFTLDPKQLWEQQQYSVSAELSGGRLPESGFL